jgi:fructose-1-phosphate kinase PfkB-like protein
MARILVVGMNPAWQTVLALPSLKIGTVIRATESQSLASGKGINCARVLSRLGHDVTVVQVLAGDRGRRCLEGCERAGLRSLHVWCEGETRQCLTLCDEIGKTVTEIIEPFAVDYRPIWGQSLLRQINELGRFDAAVVLGSLPNGWSGRFYVDLLEVLAADVKVLDTLQGLGLDSLRSVQWVKVNHEEWRAFLDRESGSHALDALASDWHALITQGGSPAYVESHFKRLGTIDMPSLDVVNPIGAGDTVSAGLTHHVLMGRDMPSAVVSALSMGAASCLEWLPAHYRPEVAEQLREKMRWQAAG